MNKITKRAVKKTLKMKKCKLCLATENLTIDHKNPISRGGTDELKNLQCLCHRCNRIKSSFSSGEIRVLFGWFLQIQSERAERGGKPLLGKINSLR